MKWKANGESAQCIGGNFLGETRTEKNDWAQNAQCKNVKWELFLLPNRALYCAHNLTVINFAAVFWRCHFLHRRAIFICFNNSYFFVRFFSLQMLHRVLIAIFLIGSSYGQSLTPYGSTSISLLDDKLTTPCVEWTGGSFAWPCSSTKSLYRSSNKYISKNVIATRAQISGDDIYLALPRYKTGVPATLVRTTFKKGICHTVLSPFPCWSLQEEKNCEALQSVVDLFIDQNKVLWALDVGVVNTLETPIRYCPPKVIALSTKTGKVLKTISLEGLVAPTSRLQNIVVDYADNKRCFVYISDAAQRSIIVYDVQASRGYRVVLPKAVTAGCGKKDVLYLLLVRKPCGSTVLYFTYLGSKHLFSIKSEYLRNGNTTGRITGE